MRNVTPPLHLRGHTWHGRTGAVANSFRYSVDYVLLDAEAEVKGPRLFRRNGRGITSLWDGDHGGAPGQGRGAPWVRDVLSARRLPRPSRIRLLTQPRVLGFVFNPVSFWLCEDDRGTLYCVIAEVTNTFGDRHSYLCCRDDMGPIGPDTQVSVTKIMHVSPFQPVEGRYDFRFDIAPDRIGIRIDYDRDKGGVIATLTGQLEPLSDRGILSMLVRRPLGSVRVLALIHWQALKLWAKGAKYRTRPTPPEGDLSR